MSLLDKRLSKIEASVEDYKNNKSYNNTSLYSKNVSNFYNNNFFIDFLLCF